jgi:Tfp pilus assembly PilM family ATPase
MAGRVKSVCGLDIRNDSICMAQYSPEAHSVTGVGVQPFEDAGDDWWKTLSAELKKLTSEGTLSGQNVVCSLPSEWALIKDISIDKDEESVEQIIKWEFSQQILGDIAQYVYDFQKVQRPVADEFDHYLVAAYRSDTVKRLAGLIRSYKMNPFVVDLDVFGLVNLLEANYRDCIAQPCAILFGDEHRLSVVLTQNGDFVDWEIQPYHLDTAAPQECVRKALEMFTALQTVQPAFFVEGAVPHTFLAGSAFSFPEVTEHLIANMQNTEVLYPFKSISFQVGRVQENDVRKYAPRLAVAVGLAVRGGAEIAS